MSHLGSALPAVHDGWLGDLTGLQSPPPEAKATCGDCVMCGDVARSGSRVTFSPDAKCCTYVPYLVNAVAGDALGGAGRRTVLDRIAARSGVTPLGLGASRRALLQLVEERSSFGLEDVVRCPHFDAGTQGCAIWASRNAVCSTWFCRHDRGLVGQRFWHAVRDLLIAVEERVARHCLVGGGLPEAQVTAVLDHRAAVQGALARANAGLPLGADDLPDDESPEWYARQWGGWQGREPEWFARCADEAGRFDVRELASDLGPLVDAVLAAHAALGRRRLPDRVQFAPGDASEATRDVMRLVGYSPLDPLILPAHLEPSLWQLDGRRVPEVLAGLSASGAAALSRDLLHELLDAGVAVEASVQVALPDRVLRLVDALAPDVEVDVDSVDAVDGGITLP